MTASTSPNPRAVPRDSGLQGFDILMTYEVPAWQGVTIARGDTIIVNPEAAPVAGDIILVSDGNELTLAAVGDNGLPTSLGDNTGAYLEGVEVLLIGVAIRVRKAPVRE